MNQDSYNSNSLGFDQPQPPQSLVIHQPHQELSIQEMEDLKQQYLDELKHLSNLEYRDEIKIAELTENFNGMSIEIRKKEKLLQLEQWANLSTHPSKRLNSFCYDDDDEDYTIAVIPSLSIEEPDNSLSMRDEHLDTIPATESDEFIKSSVENLIPILSESEGIPEHMWDVPFHDNSPPLNVLKDQIEDFSESNDEFSSIDDDSFSIDNFDYVEASPPDSELVSSEVMEIVISEVGGIDDDILLTIKDDILREKLLNVNLLIAKIEALNDNPTSSFDCKNKSFSTSLNSLFEETNTSDNSLPEFETFCFPVKEINNGSTTTPSDISLPEYEVFYDDHVKEISSGKYDCFLFKIETNSRDFTMDVVKDISPKKEPQVHNALPTHPTLQLNLKFQPSSEYLFTYVVWIFLPFLVYSVAPYYLLSLRNEDIIFDPGICISHFSRPDVSHRCGTSPRFKVLPERPMEICSSTCSPMDK
uniref:Uncharacterized protein n=1 Tax=Tanacetum cinerariifolium TaxID=118510 RepID=A0A6L2JUW4_TANCI|nr:hypothetical protein [Tanacetum cinerariifolium]